MEINEMQVRKILELVDLGLVRGVGEPTPGRMCVEACICYAMGLPHGDEPSCVGRAVRSFKIRLNDSPWPSDQARAAGLRKLAIAQLGSDTINQCAFARIVAEQTIRRVTPIALRAAATRMPAHAAALEAAAVRCEQEGTEASARHAQKVARTADADAAAAADYADLRVLLVSADIGLQALIDLKSPGCQWLFLADDPKVA